MATFYFRDGRQAEDLISLLESMEHTDDETFSFHEQNRDFYRWLRDCIDPGIAEGFRHTRSRHEMVRKIKRLL